MHIALNAQLLNTGESYRSAGVSNYCARLLRELGKLAVAGETDHRFSAFVNARDFTAEGIGLSYSRLPLHRPPARVAWEQLGLPAALKHCDADLIHGLVNVLPLRGRLPGVVTVHDLSFVRRPETLPRAKRLYLARLCRASVARAACVIAVSRQTADDLIACFDVEPEKIEIVHNGVGEEFTPGDGAGVARLRARENLPERFLLYLGTLEPRKNLDRLLHAFARWLQGRSADAEPIVLVLAGAKGWFYDEIFGLVSELALTDRVRFPGFIPAWDLPDWYRAAHGFVYPSLFEGFGLPVLEAMACGTPVLCSQAASLLEIVDDCALTFAADNSEDLVAGLERLISDDGLRAELRCCGLRRAQSFSWRRTARATVEVYSMAAVR